MINVFETIINDPEKMAVYKKSPVEEAVFMALYGYVKEGHSFSDLPWFSLSNKKVINQHKKAA